jgi:hypothetical protein
MDFDRLLTAFSGALVLWLFLPERQTNSNFIHRCFRRESWRESPWQGKLSYAAAFTLWPVIVPVLSAVFTWRNGPAVRQRTGKPIHHQIFEQFRAAALHAMLPPWYYIYGLYEREHWAQAQHYLNRFEVKRGIYDFLRRYNAYLPAAPTDSMQALSNKALFSVHCQTHGLPVVAIWLQVENGYVMAPEGEHKLPAADFFLKRQRGSGGRYAERWSYRDDGHYKDATGRKLDEQALLEHIKRLSVHHKRGFLVQPRLVNHPALADLSNGALTTVRVLTCWNERGQCEVTNAVFRMAQGNNTVVDNAHAGGIVASVDVADGRIGRAIDGATGVGGKDWCESHPQTGARFTGRTLPDWPETVALAVRVHQEAFPDMPAVGWDVALLADGPCLVEGNKRPDLDLMQMGYGQPFGNARLGELLAYQLRRALAIKYGENEGPHFISG